MIAPAADARSAATLAAGQKVGKYVLTDKLGEGGMGMVFAGRHETLGREVAIKFLRAELAGNQMVVARFQQEAQAVSRIGHPNIVAVYDFGRLEDGSLYYVMERIVGESVTARLRRPPALTDDEIRTLFEQLCRALHAAHAQRVVHRDLKPDNVLLQAQPGAPPFVKVVDFGIAKMREAGAEEAGGMTRSGTILGTPQYMAPEQITDPEHVDARADIYALGAMLFEFLTGEPPFGRGDMLVTLQRHVSEPPAPPSTRAIRPVGPALDAVVLRALAKAPGDRFPDVMAFFEALSAALQPGRAVTGRVAPVAVPAAAVPGAHAVATGAGGAGARLPLLVGLGVAVVVAGAAVGYVLRGKAPPATTAQGASGATPGAAPAPPVLGETPLTVAANKELATALSADALARRLAVDAMAEVGDRSALPQLITALGDDNPEVRRGAANAAAQLGQPGDGELNAALQAAAARSGGQVAVDIAAARLRTGDPTIVAAAEEELARALGQRDPVARLRAAVALAGVGKVQAPVLRAAIAGAPPTVRRWLRWAAYVQLHRLGDPAFEGELHQAIDGADPVARLDAAQTLARTGDAKGRMALADLAAHAPDPVDRVDAAAVLAGLDDVGAVKTLTAALADPAPAVRARAATSLGRLMALLPGKDALATRLEAMLADREPAPRIAAAAAILALEAARAPRQP